MTGYSDQWKEYVWSESQLESIKNLFICSEVLHNHQEKILFCLESVVRSSFRKYPLAPLHLEGHFGWSGDKRTNKAKQNIIKRAAQTAW